ncbi:hypothetical protein [Kocuria arenosa]|uniref:hypothetical protein n=1 Tax=Kocuria arenosa TaxID=3071446 RepID=UPI0034D6462F
MTEFEQAERIDGMYGRGGKNDESLRKEGERFLIEISREKGPDGHELRRTFYERFNQETCRRATVRREFNLKDRNEKNELSSLLADISKKSVKDYDGIMLSALVWNKGKMTVGESFWPLAKELGKVSSDLKDSKKRDELMRLTKEVNAYFAPEDGEGGEPDESPTDGVGSESKEASPATPGPLPTSPQPAQDDNEVNLVPGRAGWVTNFIPKNVPASPSEPIPAAWVDPQARDEATARHHDAVRRLSGVVQTAGHRTEVWNVGQDVAFIVNDVLVNVEVKTVSDDMSAQLRLGVGQLLEQLEHHREHMAAQTPWYVDSKVASLAGVLVVVGLAEIPPVWTRLAQRVGFTVWTCETAEQEFGKALPSVFAS